MNRTPRRPMYSPRALAAAAAQDARGAIIRADAERLESVREQARRPTAAIRADQFGNSMVEVPMQYVAANVAMPADEIIRWDLCGTGVPIAANALPTLIASVTFKRSGSVIWARCGTYDPTDLPALRIGIERTSDSQFLTTNGNGADYIEAPSLVGTDASQLWPLYYPVRENEKWSVYAINGRPSGDTDPLFAFGAFGFKWELGG